MSAVVVVDDNEDAADSLADALRDSGHEVEVAYKAKDALALLETFPADFVLLDLGLPDMDGLEVGRRIRGQARLARVRLIAVTGRAEARDRRALRETGFDGHLIKPVDLVAVERALAVPPGGRALAGGDAPEEG